MIQFQCGHCGVRLNVPDTHAGKEARCPRCKNQITVPTVEPSDAVDVTPVAVPTTTKPLDQQPLDPPKSAAADPQSPEERLRELEIRARLGLMPAPQYSGERQFAWPMDILLYATNAAGLTTIAILVGVPLLLHLVERFLRAPFPFLFPLRIIFGLYGAWYLAECVRDSARGGTRAPDLAGTLAGFSEIRLQVSNLVGVYLAFIAPVGFYYLWWQRTDAIFWALAAWAVVFFPIGLLAVIIEDSLSALNPLFLLGSMMRVLLPYLGLLMLFLAPIALAWIMPHGPTDRPPALWLEAVAGLAGGYGTFVMAHLLGRFYWRYRERLDWAF